MLASKWMKNETDKERDEEEIMRRREQGAMTFKDRLDILAGKVFGILEVVLSSMDLKYKGVLEWALHNRFLTIIIGIISLLVVVAMAIPKSGVGGPRVIIALIALLCSAVAMCVNRKSKNIAIMFGIAMAIIAMTVYLPFGFEFFTQTDQSKFKITVSNPAGTSLQATDRVVHRIEDVIDKLPEMKTIRYKVSDSVWYNPFTWSRSHMASQTGYCLAMSGSTSSGGFGSSDSGSQYANITVKLVDKYYRKRNTQEVVDWISQQVAHIPGTELVTVAVSSSGGPSGSIQKDVLGQSQEDVIEEANRVAGVIRKIPGCVDVDISYKPNKPE
jgi:multidrug efflux pump subunit AcrB